MRTNAVLSALNKKTKAQKRKINHCLLLQDVCTHNIHMDGRTVGQTQMDGRRIGRQLWMYVRYVRYVSRRGTYDGPISECAHAHAHIALIYIHNSLTLDCCFLFFSCSRNCGCVGDYWRSETDRQPPIVDVVLLLCVDVDVFVLFCFLNICGPETPRVFLYEEV